MINTYAQGARLVLLYDTPGDYVRCKFLYHFTMQCSICANFNVLELHATAILVTVKIPRIVTAVVRYDTCIDAYFVDNYFIGIID